MNGVKRTQRTALAVLVCVALLGAGAATAKDDALPIGDATRLPGTLSRSDETVEVETKLPKTLGTVISIEAEEPNGLSVAELEVLDSGRIDFAIDASSAKSGEWSLVFRGENRQCQADLEVL